MPPGVGRFGPQNLPNPLPHLNQAHSLHQNSHLHHPNPNPPSQNLGSHPAFGPGIPNNGIGLFGPSPVNPGLQGSYNVGGGGGLDGGGTGLASHAAQFSFAQAAAMEQHRSHEASSSMSAGTKGMGGRMREVWRTNLGQEMQLLRNLVERYPFISMDTEFPGVVARPIGDFPSKASYHYQTLRCNVDLLKIIQLGITLFSAEGEIPPAQADATLQHRSPYPNNLIMCPCTWTFNFQFSLEEDMYNDDSIMLLRKSGVDFEKHAEMGIDPQVFASLLITSGMALNDDVHWISFHAGYDFAYLVKMMTCQQLANDEEEHKNAIGTFFPRLIDLKFLLKHAQALAKRGELSPLAATIINNLGSKTGLQDVADELGVQRVGTLHQAGSDAWLTGLIFWQIKAKIFDGRVPEDMRGQMWGLTGVGAPGSAASQAAALAAQGHATPGLNGAMAVYGDRNDLPSTPTGNHVGLASTTPGLHGHHPGGMGTLTPGAGGVFGNFHYGK